MRSGWFLVVGLVACGGGAAERPGGHGEAPAKPAEARRAGDGHGDTAAKAFHDVLSPLWHAGAGPDRTRDTCAAAGRLRQMAEGMVSAPPPGAKPGYPEQAAALAATTGQLEKVCATPDQAGFESAFHAVHEAFHGVVEACGD